MSLITQSQAVDFEQRLNALENRVGVDRQTTDESIDDRLARLRATLDGKLAGAFSESTTTTSSSSRNTPSSSAVATKTSNEQHRKVIQKLLKELDPGIALTHQQQPLLYKRQQVLACSDELSNDFKQLDSILKLLLSNTRVDGAAEAGLEGTALAAGASAKTPAQIAQSSSSKAAATPKAGGGGPKQTQKELLQQAKKDAELKQSIQQQQQQQLEGGKRGGSSGTALRLDQVTQAPILLHKAFSRAADQKRVGDLAHKLVDLNERTRVLQSTLRHYLECYHTATMAVSEKIIRAEEKLSSSSSLAASQQQ
jgi:hypothetical protein